MQLTPNDIQTDAEVIPGTSLGNLRLGWTLDDLTFSSEFDVENLPDETIFYLKNILSIHCSWNSGRIWKMCAGENYKGKWSGVRTGDLLGSVLQMGYELTVDPVTDETLIKGVDGLRIGTRELAASPTQLPGLKIAYLCVYDPGLR